MKTSKDRSTNQPEETMKNTDSTKTQPISEALLALLIEMSKARS